MDVPAPVRSEEAEEAVRAAAPSRLRLGAPVPIASTDASSSAHSASTSRYARVQRPARGGPGRRAAAPRVDGGELGALPAERVRRGPRGTAERFGERRGERRERTGATKTLETVFGDSSRAAAATPPLRDRRSSDGRGTGLRDACHASLSPSPKPFPPFVSDNELPRKRRRRDVRDVL